MTPEQERQARARKVETLVDRLKGYEAGPCRKPHEEDIPEAADLKLLDGSCALCVGVERLRQMEAAQRAGERERLYRLLEGQCVDPVSPVEICNALGLGYTHVLNLLRQLVRAGRLRRIPTLGDALYVVPRVEAASPAVSKAPTLIDRIVELLGDGRPRSLKQIAEALDSNLMTVRGALNRALERGRVVVAERVPDPRGGPPRVLWALPTADRTAGASPEKSVA
jgi:hypothetical protein